MDATHHWFFLGFWKNSVTERVSEVGVFVTILIGLYSDLMKWAQKCEGARRCFLVSFDMIFTRICEMQLCGAVFSQTWFCLHFYSMFLDFDEIGLFWVTILRCDLGPFGRIPAMRRCEPAFRAIWWDSMACFLRFRLAMRNCDSHRCDLRCAMRDS